MWNFVVNVGPTRSVHWCWDVVLRDDVASPVIGSDPVPPAQLSSVTLETGNFEHTAEAPEAEASASDGAGDDSSPLAVAGPVMLLPICLIVCETILCAAASLVSRLVLFMQTCVIVCTIHCAAAFLMSRLCIVRL